MNIRTFVCIGCFAAVGAMGCKASLKVGNQPEPEPVAEPAPPPPEPEPEPEPVAVADPVGVRLEGDHINIDKKIMFETDSAVIRPESNELLDNIATVMKNHPEIETLHVIGHTDSTGDDNHNMELSNKRAEAVMTALKERGVEQPMDHRGAGETELTCSDETPECHDANRRVEFKVDIKGVEAG